MTACIAALVIGAIMGFPLHAVISYPNRSEPRQIRYAQGFPARLVPSDRR
jgi:hypothetical protein